MHCQMRCFPGCFQLVGQNVRCNSCLDIIKMNVGSLKCTDEF